MYKRFIPTCSLPSCGLKVQLGFSAPGSVCPFLTQCLCQIPSGEPCSQVSERWSLGVSVSHSLSHSSVIRSDQCTATAGWRGPNPLNSWFGSILPALAKHFLLLWTSSVQPEEVRWDSFRVLEEREQKGGEEEVWWGFIKTPVHIDKEVIIGENDGIIWVPRHAQGNKRVGENKGNNFYLTPGQTLTTRGQLSTTLWDS